MQQRYAVVFEPGPRNWSAYSPDLPGCVATGKTLDETRQTMQGAIEAHVRWLVRDGDTLPQPITRLEDVPGLTPTDIAEWLVVDISEPAAVWPVMRAGA